MDDETTEKNIDAASQSVTDVDTVSPTNDTVIQAESEKGGSAVVKPKRVKLINAFKVAGFLLLTLAMLAAMYFGGRPDIPGATHVYRTYRLNKMFSERENTLDILYVGHSGVMCGIAPMELYDKYGMTGYDCSQELLMPWEAYDTVVDVLKEQSPSVILLEIDMYFYDHTKDLVNSNFKRLSLSLLPFRETHQFWRTGFKRAPRDCKKGYSISTTVVPPRLSTDKPKTDKVYKMHKSHERSFYKLYELCRERGITLLMFKLPTLKYWNYEKHNCIQRFADEHGLPFLDMNYDDGAARAGVDYSKDLRDGIEHLNYYGAVKCTSALGEWINEYCTVPDRRGEYKDWDDDLVEYKATIKERLDKVAV